MSRYQCHFRSEQKFRIEPTIIDSYKRQKVKVSKSSLSWLGNMPCKLYIELAK